MRYLDSDLGCDARFQKKLSNLTFWIIYISMRNIYIKSIQSHTKGPISSFGFELKKS